MFYFSVQDVCLIFSLIIVFLSFFSTYVFQAGLVGLLVSKYKVPIMVSITYLGLSISYHVCSLNTRWYEPQSYWWTDSLLALFVIHRFGESVDVLNANMKKFNLLIIVKLRAQFQSALRPTTGPESRPRSKNPI